MSSLGRALTQDDWETCTDRHVQRKSATSQPKRGWHRCFPHIPNEEPTPQHLHFWLPASRTLRQCMLNHPFVVLCYSSPSTPIQMVFTFSSSGKHNQRMLFFNVKIVWTHISVNTIILISALCLTALALQGQSRVAAWDYMAQNIYSLALYRKVSQSENNNYEYVTKHHTTVCT